MFDWRPILFVNGVLLSILSAVMLLPALIDVLAGNDGWRVFMISAIGSSFVGISLILTNTGYRQTFNLRQAFVFTTSSYVFMSFFAAIPFYLGMDKYARRRCLF